MNCIEKDLKSDYMGKLNGIYEDICNIVGVEKTLELYKMLCGSQINFPTRLYDRDYVCKEASKMYNGTSESINQIAARFGYSERTIRKMVQGGKIKILNEGDK